MEQTQLRYPREQQLRKIWEIFLDIMNTLDK